MRILVTGASGFIGRRLLPALVEAGHEVSAAALPAESDALAEEFSEARWLSWDLSQPGRPEDIPATLDCAVHLAQSPRYRDFPGSARDIFAVNCAATLEILDCARDAGASKFLLASSGSVYRRSDSPLAEDADLAPADFYSLTKLLAERLADSYRAFFDVLTVRFFCVYGPGQRDRLVPNLIERVRGGNPVSLAGEEGMRINPLYVDDAAAALAGLLEASGAHVLNAAGGEALSVRQMATAIGEALGRGPVFADPGPEEGDLVGDTTALEELLDWRPRVSFAEGIARTLSAPEPPAP